MRNAALAALAVLSVAALLIGTRANGADVKKPAAPAGSQKAIFAGGCFWCEESAFQELKGVSDAVSGYTGGTLENPVYENHTGHVEAVEVTFDPKVITYDKLLEVFWHNADPTDAGGQFCDRGDSYTSAIFTIGDEQKAAAEKSKAELEKTKPFKSAIVTKITAASKFWPAEDYHQDYFQKNPVRYRFYRQGCGRDARLKALWGPLAGHVD